VFVYTGVDMSRKIFIDAGSNNGDTIEKFYNKKLFDVMDPQNYEVYAFDVTDFSNEVGNVLNRLNLKGAFINKAVWVNDGYLEFDFTKDNSVSTTISDLSPTHKRMKRLKKQTSKIPCFDFSKWIIDNFSKQDTILLKMDIEGSEFEVLPKMIKEGSLSYINGIRIEFHDRLLLYPKETRKRLSPIKEQVLEYCKVNNIPIKKW